MNIKRYIPFWGTLSLIITVLMIVLTLFIQSYLVLKIGLVSLLVFIACLILDKQSYKYKGK